MQRSQGIRRSAIMHTSSTLTGDRAPVSVGAPASLPFDSAPSLRYRHMEFPSLNASLFLANAQIADLKAKLTGAEEKARKCLAAELHDDVQQILFGLSLNMAASQGKVADHLPVDVIGGWMHSVHTAMDHLHQLTVELSKPVIDSQELPTAMRSYVEALTLAPNQRILFETDAEIGTLAPNVATACFRFLQEALGNAVKHSGGTHLLVRLKSSVARLTVSIRDDGVGFDIEEARAHAIDAGSIGLSSMRQRAALAGGHFGIQSAIGHGTRIYASFPHRTHFAPHIGQSAI